MTHRDHPVEALSEYLDGDLAPERRAAVEEHVGGCPDCALALEELRAVMARARALPNLPPARDLWPAIEARLEERTPGTVVALPARQTAWRRRFSFSVPQLAAAGIALVMLSGGAVWFAMRATQTPWPGALTIASRTGADSIERPASFEAARYEAAIDDLEQVLERNRGHLDPATIRTVEANLTLIDGAIEQARRALLADPSNPYLNGHLASQMQRKLRVLQRATDVATADYVSADS